MANCYKFPINNMENFYRLQENFTSNENYRKNRLLQFAIFCLDFVHMSNPQDEIIGFQAAVKPGYRCQARTLDKKVPADLRAGPLATVPPKPPSL
ncbi:hypothetical protein PoB_002294700 [Plakobranchus ocellatus]|uniref:Uncharacterized protein n=1 Tax=Plakobranchus ocellatus TaxID=259542 RepID=A0AAV3ZPL4_9GAST|nr:hypothetical protein PoB_002294700 [Plakobranchus ocellatus]